MRRSWYVVVAGLLVLATGCAPDLQTESQPVPASVEPTATKTVDPLAQCTHQLSYWVEESVRGAPDRGYDYQEMGLSNAKYQALRGVLERMEAKEAAGPLPADWVDVEVTQACQKVIAMPSSTSTGGGWQ